MPYFRLFNEISESNLNLKIKFFEKILEGFLGKGFYDWPSDWFLGPFLTSVYSWKLDDVIPFNGAKDRFVT